MYFSRVLHGLMVAHLSGLISIVMSTFIALNLHHMADCKSLEPTMREGTTSEYRGIAGLHQRYQGK